MPTERFSSVCLHVKRICTQWRKRLDQRFEPEEEAKFTKSLEPAFFFPCIFAGILVGYLCSSATYSTYQALKAANNGGSGLFVAMVGSRLLAGVMTAIMIIACLLKKSRCSRSINLEFMSLAWSFTLVFVFTWFNAWHGCLLFGKDPHIIFPDWVPTVAEGYALLCLSTVVSGCCLIAPVRCHLSWIIPAFGMTSYICMTCICGSASPSYLTLSFASLSGIIAITLSGSYKNEVFLRREWLAQQKVGTQQDLLETQYGAVCRILNLLCDCMIRLGPDLELLEPSQRLGAMLLKRGQSLTGACIQDFIFDETDRQLFREMVVGVGDGHRTDGMFHVNFKDSYGKAFPVDIYHTRIANKDDIEYLVGIVENSVREPQPATGSAKFEYQPHQEPNIIGFTEDSWKVRGPPVSDDIAESSASSFEAMSGSMSNLGEIAVDVVADPFNGFPILRCTPGFTAISGPITEREQLSKFIVDSVRLKKCIEDMLNVFYNSCQNVVFEDIVFRKPNSSIEYAIDAAGLDFTGISLDDEHPSGSEIVLRAEFHGIRQQRRSKRSRSSRRTPRISSNLQQI